MHRVIKLTGAGRIAAPEVRACVAGRWKCIARVGRLHGPLRGAKCAAPRQYGAIGRL